MMTLRIVMVAALSTLVVACGGQSETSPEAAAPVEEVAPTMAVEVVVPTEAPMSANLPAASELTLETLPGEGGGTEIQTTPSGLGYVVLREGSGDSPLPTSTVTVHYTGFLTDGTVFDSSIDRGEPATFPLQGVIAGWTEGLQLMAPGAKYKFITPPDLGYGPAGAPPVIPPNATLVFDVELLEVQ